MATAGRLFKDREDAGRKLAQRLSHLRSDHPLVLAIPRGAVQMAKIIADELEGDLDILLVHKVGHPQQPEFAVAAVNETGDVYFVGNEGSQDLRPEQLNQLISEEVKSLKTRRALYTPYRSAASVQGRVCIIVDDGIATGSTVSAAIGTLIAGGARSIVVAAPVASREAVELLRDKPIELCVLETPPRFFSVSLHFESFEQVSDREVIEVLSRPTQEIKIENGSDSLDAILSVPPSPKGLVIFAHGSGSSRLSSRNQFVAGELNNNGYATLLADLLTKQESDNRDLVFDIEFLATRVESLISWSQHQAGFKNLPIALFGASTGAAAALEASVHSRFRISAVISRGGRVDLADEFFDQVKAPTLLIVGSLDSSVLDLNRLAKKQIPVKCELKIVNGASHLFEEDGALDEVAKLATDWLNQHLIHQNQTGRLERTQSPSL